MRTGVGWSMAFLPVDRAASRTFVLRGIATLFLLVGVIGLGNLLPVPEGGSRVFGGPFSLAPPVLAIGLAMIWRRVLLSLFLGVVAGALLVEGFSSPVRAGWSTLADYVVPAVLDVENLKIFAFTLLLMGMVGILIRSGGVDGVVAAVSRFARSRRSGQTLVASMGVAIFFDDYANTVVVGSSARPITDRLGISREKLAYIVDSTAAPVASLAIISTWIGIEIRYLDEQIPYLKDVATTGYGVFLNLIPVRFYCILALAMVFVVALLGRDFGPMLRAERRAAGGQTVRPGSRNRFARGFEGLSMREGNRPNGWFGLLPVMAVLGSILVSFFVMGRDRVVGGVPSVWSFSGWRDAFSAVPDSTLLLVFAGGAGTLVAGGMSLFGGKLRFRELLDAFWKGASSLGSAIVLLILAISLRKVTDGDHLDSASYVLTLLSGIDPLFIPLAVFVAAAGIAFATGTSWGTMGILLPFAVPLAAHAAELSGNPALLLLATGAVLDGAVFGDHCSPISDTTVLSSIGSMCDLMDHVRTQAPYALAAMSVAGLAGYFAVAQGWWGSGAAVLVGVGVLLALVRLVGRKPVA